MQPIRVQRKRVKGYRMPENTVSVTRPGKWGNPFKTDIGIDAALKKYKAFILKGEILEGHIPPSIDSIKKELAGKNLACFCPLGSKCHADILLEIANQ